MDLRRRIGDEDRADRYLPAVSHERFSRREIASCIAANRVPATREENLSDKVSFRSNAHVRFSLSDPISRRLSSL